MNTLSPPSSVQDSFFLSGSLSADGQNVTGELRVLDVKLPNCVVGNVAVSATGSLDQAGNLSLTAPVAGGMAKLAVNITSDTPYAKGTAEIDGGSCAQAQGPLLAIPIPNVSGTYTGTLKQIAVPPVSTPGTIQASLSLTQAVQPAGDGTYLLSGSMTYTGSCSGTFSFSQGEISGFYLTSANIAQLTTPNFLTGGYLVPTGTGNLGSAAQVELFAASLPGCAGGSFSGTLTAQ